MAVWLRETSMDIRRSSMVYMVSLSPKMEYKLVESNIPCASLKGSQPNDLTVPE